MRNILFQKEKPAFSIRVIHLDLKGLPPTPKRLLELLDILAELRYNTILVEWENMFPWTVDSEFRSPKYYTPKQLDGFYKKAKELKIELIPLVQTIGHMETFLSPPKYKHLRECPDKSDVINPLAKGSKSFIESLVNDVLKQMPHINHFHLGGDEAWTFGTNPMTKDFIKINGKSQLFLDHIESIIDLLSTHNIRPIMWHDMVRQCDISSLERIKEKVDIMIWGYHEHPDRTTSHYNTNTIKFLHDCGFTLWGATAYKGADGDTSDVPNLRRRYKNASAWVSKGKQFSFKGLVATGWSRYSTNRPQNEPIDAALDSLANIATLFHDGVLPYKKTSNLCIEALGEIKQASCFKTVKKALQQLSQTRRALWDHLNSLCEQIAIEKLYPKRRTSKTSTLLLSVAPEKRQALDDAAKQVKEVLKGLVDEIHIEEYLSVRLNAIDNITDYLSSEIALLNSCED